VWVSVIPSSKEAEVMREFGRRAGEMQFKLNRLLNIRPMPRISFEIDHGPENAAKVEKMLLEDDNKEV
jgi:ribosome-binding factor A